MLRKALKCAGLGFLIGMIVGNVIAALTGFSAAGGHNIVTPRLLGVTGNNFIPAVILQSLLSGIYGALCFGGIVFYDIERWPLAAATAAHCALIVLSYIPIALFLGWANQPLEFVIVAAVQIVVFFIIWLILYFSYKKQIRELNDMQKDFSQREEE